MKSFWFFVTIAISQWNSGTANLNDFSSFLSANASLAVVVDQDYMAKRGENILANFRKILGETIREHLKNGGLNVRYFTWSAVHLRKEFIAAITVASCDNTWKMYESSQSTSVLLISITDGDCPRLPLNRAIMIPVVANGNEFPQMILDAKAQKILQWKSAVLLVDQSIIYKNPVLVESVVHENSKHDITPISLFLYQMNDTFSSRSQRKRIAIRQALEPFARDPNLSNQFIVFSTFFEDIIEVAALLNMFHIYNQWLFFVINGTKREEFNAELVTQNLGEGANIAFLQNATVSNCPESLNCTLSDVSMAFVTSLSRMILEEQSIYGEISDEEWESIRFTKQEKQDEILRYMKDYLKDNSKCSSCSNWRMQTSITWGKSQEHKNTFNALRDSRNKYFEFIDVGFWTPLLGFNTKEFLFPHINQRFRNITLDVVTVHNPPWQILTKNNKGEIVAHSGIVMEILKELSRMLNFTYRLHEPKKHFNDDEISSYNETNNLMGSLTYTIPYQVIEMTQGNRFFLAAVAATIDEADTKAFNYTLPISVQKYTFISRKPDEVSRIYLFTAPFTLETWGSLVGVIFIVAPILYAINCLVPMQSLKTKGLCNMKNCFWYIYGALLQQGGVYLPKTDSGRIVVGIWWIVVIVLVTTYCGNLVAFLTFPKFEPGLEYLYQIFKQNDVEHLALRNGTFFQKYSSVSNHQDIRRYVDRATIYNSIDTERLEDVEKGERVNVDWRINLQLVIQHHYEKDKVCKFVLAKENFVEEPIGLILPANSPYLQLINDQITRLFQMGFIERWHQTNLPSKDKCSGKGILRQAMNHKVDLVDMQGCFLVLLFGFTIATIVVFLEYCYYYWYVLDRKKAQKVFSH